MDRLYRIVNTILIAYIVVLSVLLLSTGKSNDRAVEISQEWKRYANYVAGEATTQCEMWRDKYTSMEKALAICNGFIEQELNIEYTDMRSND